MPNQNPQSMRGISKFAGSLGCSNHFPLSSKGWCLPSLWCPIARVHNRLRA